VFTNGGWTFSIEATRKALKFRELRVVNDFVANALAIPQIKECDRLQIGCGTPVAAAPVGLIGPGTGLGVGAFIPDGDGGIALQSEGGHVTMPPADAKETAVIELLRRRYDHVSAERILSGPGLINLYVALRELVGAPAAAFTPVQITDPQTWEKDSCAREATAMFCSMLGALAGNLALTLGARGGIYITGGIIPKLGSIFSESLFRSRFEAKGRLRDYLTAIPTYVITHPYPALVGATALVRSTARANRNLR
jgi:glucokinase